MNDLTPFSPILRETRTTMSSVEIAAPTLSNALADLAERIKASVTAQAQAESTAADEALAAGAMLAEAKAQSTHGAWLPFLTRAGVNQRQARRLMQLARSGLKSDTVSDLGGVKATLGWLRAIALPDSGQALLAQAGAAWPYALIVPGPAADLYDVARVEADGAMTAFRKPVTAAGVQPVLFFLMSDCLSSLTFQLTDDADGFWRDLVKGRGTFSDPSPYPVCAAEGVHP